MRSSRDRNQRRWTLMLIGDHGKVIELKHIRWLIGFTVFILFCAVLVAVILFVNNNKLSSANDNLRQSLETSRARMKKGQQQTDLLMAQLALAEARAKNSDYQKSMNKSQIGEPVGASVEETDKPGAKPIASKADDKPPAKPAVKANTKPANKPVPKPKPAAKPKSVPKSADTANPPPKATPIAGIDNSVMVEIDDLQLTRPAGSGTVNLEFKVRNVSPQPQRLEGRVLAILKGDNLPPSKWIPIPNVKLVDGKPAEVRGHRFAINNWRTMRMRTRFSGPLEQFNLVEIYVYSKDGEIWLRELEPVTPGDQ